MKRWFIKNWRDVLGGIVVVLAVFFMLVLIPHRFWGYGTLNITALGTGVIFLSAFLILYFLKK